MIPLPRFEIDFPETFADAAAALARTTAEACVLAGGTSLIVNIKQGLKKPERLIWLGRIPELRTVSFSPGIGLRVGAMCTLNDLVAADAVRRYYPSISEAARSVASPAIRNRATVGGNLCQDTRCFYYDQSEPWRTALGGCIKSPLTFGKGICHATPGLERCGAVFCSDLAPLLVALNASVTIANHEHKRTGALVELYRDDGAGHLVLRHGEIVTDVVVPPPRPNQYVVFKKMRDRPAIDFALANVGLNLTVDSDLVCRYAKIVVGAVQSMPVEISQAGPMLVDRQLTDELIRQTGKEASTAVTPVPNVDEPVGYRKRMVSVLVERALHEVRLRSLGTR